MALCERTVLELLRARGPLRRRSGLSYLCLNSVEQGKSSAYSVDLAFFGLSKGSAES